MCEGSEVEGREHSEISRTFLWWECDAGRDGEVREKVRRAEEQILKAN